METIDRETSRALEKLPEDRESALSIPAPPEPQLTAVQQTAMVEIVNGRSFTDAAKTAGVTRMTVYRWMKSDPIFRAVYEQWVYDVRHGVQAKLAAVATQAAACLEANVSINGRLALQSLKFLEQLKMLRNPPEPGDPPMSE